MARIAVIPGDGVGPEVTAQAVRILDLFAERDGIALDRDLLALGADRYLETGVTISEEEFRSIEEDFDAVLLGALGDPRVPSNAHARDILLGLRFRLDLYVNHRPCRLVHPALSPLADGGRRPMDLHIFRENTEGIYVGMGGNFKEGTPDEVAIQEDLNTWKGVERIVRVAMEYARRRELESVTLVDKANAMPAAGRLWRRAFAAVHEDFPELETSAMYVDAMAMDLVRNPDRHRVIVTSNLFGDILSDLAAALTGGLGLAPSANLHPGSHALFEPVHGSAPDIAGKGVANPMAATLCVGLLLEHLGHEALNHEVVRTVEAAVAAGVTTPDLGGRLGTVEVGDWIVERLSRAAPVRNLE